MPPKPSLSSEIEYLLKLFPILEQVSDKDIRRVYLHILSRGAALAIRESARKIRAHEPDEVLADELRLRIYQTHPGDLIDGI